MKKQWVQIIAGALLFIIGVAVYAQTPVKVQKAELSIPFGVVKGRIVAAGDTMIFVDEENTEASFAIDRANIKGWAEQDGVITIDTNRAVKDRSGERSRLAFRLTEGNSAALSAWAKNIVAAPSTASTGVTASTANVAAAAGTAATPAADSTGAKVYQAQQKRFPFGTTDGKLVIKDNEIAFESLDDIKRSQRWSYQDIKEIKQTSTYLIEIVPFRGDKYKLELQGEGISSAQFKALTDRIASARTTK